jgi:hypothetical protein
MDTLDLIKQTERPKGPASADRIREVLVTHAKNFKVSWVNLGQALYPVWKDKLFYGWGFDKFEYYTERELGIQKPTAIKLLKTYFFLEQDEPAYLTREFPETRKAAQVPDCDAVNVLRLARQKRELNREDYQQIKKAAFDQGKDASGLRKDLTQLMKERKPVDPDEERQKRSAQSLQRMLTALKNFKKDMETLKIAPADIMKEADDFMERLQKALDVRTHE